MKMDRLYFIPGLDETSLERLSEMLDIIQKIHNLTIMKHDSVCREIHELCHKIKLPDGHSH